MLSGTFGAIFTDVVAGTPFSQAVRKAKEAGEEGAIVRRPPAPGSATDGTSRANYGRA